MKRFALFLVFAGIGLAADAPKDPPKVDVAAKAKWYKAVATLNRHIADQRQAELAFHQEEKDIPAAKAAVDASYAALCPAAFDVSFDKQDEPICVAKPVPGTTTPKAK